jgi:hypothetical protein
MTEQEFANEAGASDNPADIYDQNGVDRTLVRACLRDTPAERLEALEAVYLLREGIGLVGEQIPPTH